MVWTLEDLRLACSWTPDEWLSWHVVYEWLKPAPAKLKWDWIIFAQRLVWTYGEAGALERLNTPLAVAA